MSTNQKVAVVTGASQGLGEALVRAYRSQGFAVVANSRNIREYDDAGIVTVKGDVGERSVAEKIINIAVERFGRVDTLINNAGIFISKPFTEYTVDDFQAVMNVNVAGFFHITQFALRKMLEQGCGHVVQMTTTLVSSAISAAPTGLATLTKGGLDAVTRGLAIEYAKKGIRVNAIAPGMIRTPMHSPESLDFLAATHPLGRIGEPQDIVDAVMYLEKATFVTGETINVDGGRHAGY